LTPLVRVLVLTLEGPRDRPFDFVHATASDMRVAARDYVDIDVELFINPIPMNIIFNDDITPQWERLCITIRG